MTVATLIHLNDPDLYRVQTLVLETIRVGFPNASIRVFQNGGFDSRILGRCEDIKADYTPFVQNRHHANWIEQMIESTLRTIGPLIIVDPDVIFWKEFKLTTLSAADPKEILLAGNIIPAHRSEFGGVVYQSRIHTSLMWIPNPPALVEHLKEINPCPKEFKYPSYFPINYFAPQTHYLDGECVFLDTCANLYQALGPRYTAQFGEETMECYDHVGSACFYPELRACVENKDVLDELFFLARTNPEKLKSLWREQKEYYRNRAQLL